MFRCDMRLRQLQKVFQRPFVTDEDRHPSINTVNYEVPFLH